MCKERHHWRRSGGVGGSRSLRHSNFSKYKPGSYSMKKNLESVGYFMKLITYSWGITYPKFITFHPGVWLQFVYEVGNARGRMEEVVMMGL